MEIEIHCTVITELVFHLCKLEYDLPSGCQPLASIVFLPLPPASLPPTADPGGFVYFERYLYELSFRRPAHRSRDNSPGRAIFACPEIKSGAEVERENLTSLRVNN